MRTTPRSPRPPHAAASGAPGRAAGRREGEAGARDKILDASEEAFGADGYDAVSLRAIAARAGVEVGLIGYYFGSKEKLYLAALQRRADELSKARLRLLDEARRAADGASPSLEAIVEAYVRPLFDLARSRNRQQRSYGRLLSRDGARAPSARFMSELMDPTSNHFISALRYALPDTPIEDIYWGYSFLKSTMLGVVSENGRIDLISRGLCRSSDIEGAYRRMIPFLVGGFFRLGPSAR